MRTNGSRSRPERRQKTTSIAAHLRNVPRSGIRDFFEIVSARKDVISLGIGEPDFVTPWAIRESAIHALDQGATSYTSNLGMLDLRKAISRYVADSFAVNYEPNTEIIVTVGVSEAVDLALRAILDPGDEVLYHEPCYVSYAPVITFSHGVPVPVPTQAQTGFTLTREMLENSATPRTKALILNFPTNPTGAVLNRSELDGIAAFAIERDLIVITDEIYSELTYEGDRLSIAAMPGMKERTIFLNGFSKAFAMTGFRVGFAAAPAMLIEAMMKIHQYTIMCAPTISQMAAIEALRSGKNDMTAMTREYRARRNFICAALNDMGLPCQLPKGAFYVFPYIKSTGLSSGDFALQLLERENVACVPGTAFGASGEGFLRCAYATEMSQIKEAMARMADFVGALRVKK